MDASQAIELLRDHLSELGTFDSADTDEFTIWRERTQRTLSTLLGPDDPLVIRFGVIEWRPHIAGSGLPWTDAWDAVTPSDLHETFVTAKREATGVLAGAIQHFEIQPNMPSTSAVQDDTDHSVSRLGPERSAPSAFFLTPFSPEAAGDEDPATFELALRAVLEGCSSAGVDLVRADNIFAAGVVMDQVRRAIEEADLVIALCTGKNANVFYELGIAHMLGHEPILVARTAADLPFDVAHRRAQLYDRDIDGLADRIGAAVRETLAEREVLDRRSAELGVPTGTLTVEAKERIRRDLKALRRDYMKNQAWLRSPSGPQEVLPTFRDTMVDRLLSARDVLTPLSHAAGKEFEDLAAILANLDDLRRTGIAQLHIEGEQLFDAAISRLETPYAD